MFKVSFKEDCMKVQTFNSRATIVTMVGHMILPTEIWTVFPNKVANWMWQHPSIDASWGSCTKENEVIRIEFSGKSVCSEDDIFNKKTGIRIAESRAKIKLYKFMWQLTGKLIWHYLTIICGNFEGHTKPAVYSNDSLWAAQRKYRELLIKESHHLGKLLEKA